MIPGDYYYRSCQRPYIVSAYSCDLCWSGTISLPESLTAADCPTFNNETGSSNFVILSSAKRLIGNRVVIGVADAARAVSMRSSAPEISSNISTLVRTIIDSSSLVNPASKLSFIHHFEPIHRETRPLTFSKRKPRPSGRGSSGSPGRTIVRVRPAGVVRGVRQARKSNRESRGHSPSTWTRRGHIPWGENHGTEPPTVLTEPLPVPGVGRQRPRTRGGDGVSKPAPFAVVYSAAAGRG